MLEPGVAVCVFRIEGTSPVIAGPDRAADVERRDGHVGVWVE